MSKETKDIKVQIRLSVTEKTLLDKLVASNPELTISKLFRDTLNENCAKFGIKLDEIKPEEIPTVIAPAQSPS
jgi:predicted flavoprotein YhiN